MNKHIINDFYQELGLSGVQEFLTRREKKGGVPYIVLKEGFLEACRRKDVELIGFLKDQVKPNLHEKGMFHLVAGFGPKITIQEAFDLFPHYASMNHEELFRELIRREEVHDSQTVLSLCKSVLPISVYIFFTSPHKHNQDIFEEMIEKLVIPKQTYFNDFGLILKQADETQFDQLLGKVKDTLWFMEQQPLLASFCLDLVDHAYHDLFEKAKKLTPFIARDQLEKTYHEQRNLSHQFRGGFSQATFVGNQSTDGSYIKNPQVQEILRLIDKHALQREMDVVIAQKEGEPRSPSRKRM